MKIFTAPESTANADYSTVFLAGSIEMGAAENWQERAIKLFEETYQKMGDFHSEKSIINPRRKDWDSSWEQKFESPEFYQQVTWEIHNLKKANSILFYFDPSTKSPITLLELGLIAGMNAKRAVVVCPEPFYRKGNVDILCHLYGIPQFSTLEEAITYILKY
jgi:hypothetical protein